MTPNSLSISQHSKSFICSVLFTCGFLFWSWVLHGDEDYKVISFPWVWYDMFSPGAPRDTKLDYHTARRTQQHFYYTWQEGYKSHQFFKSLTFAILSLSALPNTRLSEVKIWSLLYRWVWFLKCIGNVASLTVNERGCSMIVLQAGLQSVPVCVWSKGGVEWWVGGPVSVCFNK